MSVIAVATLSSCAPTTYESDAASSGSVASASDVTATTLPSGPASELLPRLAEAMNSLSSYIGPDQGQSTPPGKDRVLADIDNLWNAASTEVAATDPSAADSIGRMVDLAHTAVERNRPADADKAAKFAGQVISDYLGD